MINLYPLLQKFAVLMFLSFLLLLIGVAQSGVTPSFAVVLHAGFWGIILFMRFRVETWLDSSVEIAYKIISSDGVVIAIIEERKFQSSVRFIGKVKRNYQDGVFVKEEEFKSLGKAQLWLNETYQQELEKHLCQVSIREHQEGSDSIPKNSLE